jgi:DNA-binding NtrC family response regulator
MDKAPVAKSELGSTDRSYETTRNGAPTTLVLRSILPGEVTAVPLLGGRRVLGRSSECDLVLDKPRVSRRHAEIQRQGPIYALRDLESTNGTYLDGRRVQHACLEPGSLLRLGEWLGIVEYHVPGASNPGVRELEPGIFGGREIAALFREAELGVNAGLPIVLQGETGTGKELLARAIHAYTGRRGPLHAINCAALPAALAESELFGNAVGAFTGAERARRGHLAAAHGGTLFLDEALDLPLSIQAKLLRALEQKEVVPLGETRAVPFDAAIVLACQRPLEDAVQAGVFRADLAARVSGAVLRIPPLRHRLDEIPSLFHEFLRRERPSGVPAVTAKAYECLCLQPWRGNVRELEMLARNLASRLREEPLLDRRHLPEATRAWAASVGSDTSADVLATANRNEYDAERLARAMSQVDGNVSAAARKIGISRQRAYRLLKPERSSS